MDAIYSMFSSLKIDSTFYVQFVLFVVFFNIAAPLFFKRLQAVIDLREAKTTKLDSDASHIYSEVADLESQYKATVEKTHHEEQAIVAKVKAEVAEKEKAILTAEEAKLTADYDAKRAELLSSIKTKKAEILSEAEKLSNQLVEKLTK